MTDKNYFSKITSSNPISNSILDIITIGDTVWLGTSRGVSVSFDRGENWTNFYGTSPFGNDNVSAIGYDNGVFWAATATSVEGTWWWNSSQRNRFEIHYQQWIRHGQQFHNLLIILIPIKLDMEIIFWLHLPVTVGEQNLTYDIAFTPGTVWITSFAGGFKKVNKYGSILAKSCSSS